MLVVCGIDKSFVEDLECTGKLVISDHSKILTFINAGDTNSFVFSIQNFFSL